MTPKEEAKELVSKYNSLVAKNTKFTSDIELKKSKQCALIAVDEILNALDSKKIIYGSEYHFEENDYWEQVKQEICDL